MLDDSQANQPPQPASKQRLAFGFPENRVLIAFSSLAFGVSLLASVMMYTGNLETDRMRVQVKSSSVLMAKMIKELIRTDEEMSVEQAILRSRSAWRGDIDQVLFFNGDAAAWRTPADGDDDEVVVLAYFDGRDRVAGYEEMLYMFDSRGRLHALQGGSDDPALAAMARSIGDHWYILIRLPQDQLHR